MSATFGWETLAPQDGGRRLFGPDKSHTVSAKVRTGGATRGYLYLDLFSQEAGWSIIVLDDGLRPVIQGFGRRKSDAWEHCERELKAKGLLAA